jgi:hypothetical protein
MRVVSRGPRRGRAARPAVATNGEAPTGYAAPYMMRGTLRPVRSS